MYFESPIIVLIKLHLFAMKTKLSMILLPRKAHTNSPSFYRTIDNSEVWISMDISSFTLNGIKVIFQKSLASNSFFLILRNTYSHRRINFIAVLIFQRIWIRKSCSAHAIIEIEVYLIYLFTYLIQLFYLRMAHHPVISS